jgi:hypothetical protein
VLPAITMKQATPVKILINIGATFDIPTGCYVKGQHGESLLLGGLGYLTGMTGIGNSFKSTIMHYQMLSAADRLSSTAETHMDTYDTEINIHEHRLKALYSRFPSFSHRDLFNENIWTVTDKEQYYGDQWFEELKKYLKAKSDMGAKCEYTTPFLERDGTTLMKTIIPTFSEVDSFSAFETSDVAKIQEDNELGASGGNTIHMRQGLAKLRFLMEMPTLGAKSCHFTLLTAHLGKDIAMASGPHQAPPAKKLQHMRQGDKIKGVTDQFFFLTNNFWMTQSVTPLITKDRTPEYPSDKDDNMSGDMDLNLITLKSLRGKAGPSGFTLEIVVSQTEGVLPSLTEFNYIKSTDRFGLEGNLQHYNLEIYPDVKLSRTTVRGKLDNDLKLQRAMNITSELCQMHQFYRSLSDELMTAKQLYEGIKNQGYDWEFILTKTRGWWTVNNDKHPSLYYLSTLDLVRMARGTYHPYWLEADKKNIKKQYQH